MKPRPITETYGSAIRQYHLDLDKYISEAMGSNLEKLEQFPKYVPRESMTKFLARYELFKMALAVQGSIVEGGVYWGGGLMAFAQFSAILEPVNFQRLIIGFDTFAGYPELHRADLKSVSKRMHRGGFNAASCEDLTRCIQLYDQNRFLGHLNKVVLVKGDASKTIPAYLKDNPHTIISLLYLDFNLYKPTKAAIEHFLPRMPKGGIIAFDEINDPRCPGETLAILETIGIRSIRIERFNFEPRVSYVVLG